MTENHCIALASKELRSRAALMLESGFDPDFVYTYLKAKMYKTMSGIPPITFKSNGEQLRNYRIYGNTGGVGDLVESGEHTGEYAIPVVVSGKNLINLGNIAAYGEQYAPYIEDGQIILPPLLGSDSQNIMLLIDTLSEDTVFTVSFDAWVTGANTGVVWFDGYPDSVNRDKSLGGDKKNNLTSSPTHFTYSGVLGGGTTCVRFYRGSGTSNASTTTVYVENVQLELGTVETAYEPYHTALVTNIYLSEPLGKISETADYIDYKTQKRYDSDGSINSIELPIISTTQGTNILSIATTVQPSKVTVKYKR